MSATGIKHDTGKAPIDLVDGEAIIAIAGDLGGGGAGDGGIGGCAVTSRILVGDMRERLAELPDASIDAIVTDPPYGLEFMGKDWDRPWAVSAENGVGYAGRDDLKLPSHRDNRNANCRTCGGRARGAKRCSCAAPNWDRDPASDMKQFQTWTESWARVALRVLKPGGHLLSFGGTRTYHRMAVGVEDAGFEIRDQLCWMYGQGFPKSHNLDGDWDGWGTALKPAYEPIIVARKPFRGTVAANVREHGTGAINIDACRIDYLSDADKALATPQGRATSKPSAAIGAEPDAGRGMERVEFERGELKGRWPANVILDEAAGALLDEMSGELTSGVPGSIRIGVNSSAAFGAESRKPGTPLTGYGDTGGASRFYYCAKADRSERNIGLHGMPERTPHPDEPNGRAWDIPGSHSTPRTNHHPTVKPIDLMQWLVRLVTPPGGTVLDPFMGSGTTGIAASREGFHFIGVELNPEYVEIARRRIYGDAPLLAEVEVA